MASKDSSNPLVAIGSTIISAIVGVAVILYIMDDGAANADGASNFIVGLGEFILSTGAKLKELFEAYIPRG